MNGLELKTMGFNEGGAEQLVVDPVLERVEQALGIGGRLEDTLPSPIVDPVGPETFVAGSDLARHVVKITCSEYDQVSSRVLAPGNSV